MSLSATAARAGNTAFAAVWRQPLALTILQVQAGLAAEGAELRWWRADKAAMAADAEVMRQFFNH